MHSIVRAHAINYGSWRDFVKTKCRCFMFFLLQMTTTSESVFQRNVNDMMSEAGCIRDSHCFLFYHLGDAVNGPTAWQPLTTINTAIGLQKATVQVYIHVYTLYRELCLILCCKYIFWWLGCAVHTHLSPLQSV